jgi:Mlc titration factor MtfA (ptsG expression regulator)
MASPYQDPRIALHEEVDQEYRKLIDSFHASDPFEFWTVSSLVRLWAEEKQYIDRYGHRYPRVVNVIGPENVEEVKDGRS